MSDSVDQMAFGRDGQRPNAITGVKGQHPCGGSGALPLEAVAFCHFKGTKMTFLLNVTHIFVIFFIIKHLHLNAV